MIYFIILTLFLVGSHSAFADTRFAAVEGYCYLQGVESHEGSKVLFTAVSASANTDSTYTNEDGSFLMGLSEGIYTVQYLHVGWLPYVIPDEISFFEDTTLDIITLSEGLMEEVSGPQSGLWNSYHTYQVIGDISVSDGDTLIIEPGVTIKFMDYYSFAIHGTLVAAGTEADSIRFTSGQTAWNPNDWGNINFDGNSTSNSLISNSIIEYANQGINCGSSSSPTISNNKISNNNNGGIYCGSSSSPTISNNTVSNNIDFGIYCEHHSSPTISNNVISNSNNGIYCNVSSPTISNNTIIDNYYSGITCYNDSSPTISNNTISNNNNGISCSYNSFPIISNNTISNNSIGINCNNSSPAIFNNILYNNNTGIFVDSTSALLEHNLFWLNDNAGEGSEIPAAFGEIVTVNANGDSCDTYLNLFMDPMFIDPLNFDFTITEDSPCIDAGNPDSLYYDPDGTIADMGAFYFDQGSEVPVINDFTGEPVEGSAPLVVQFAQDITGPVTEYEWLFGEGGTSSMPNPVYVYTIPGTYSVTLTATGPGGTDSMTRTDYINVTATGVAIEPIPIETKFIGNFPNPFNPETRITFCLGSTEPAELTIYNLKGQLVKTLVNETLTMGKHSIVWDGKDKYNYQVSSGLYLMQLKTGQQSLMKKIILLK